MRPDPIIKQAGVNDSEQRLVKLCAGTFLELWSYPNVFRSQHANGDPEGKEVCDLVVVFGDRLLIFSDKRCELKLKGDLDVDWRRWFRRAVRGAEKQLRGAERWLTNSPESIFLDRQCEQPMPVDLSQIDAKKTHRIVVASGASASIRDWSNGDWPGLVLFTPLKDDHHDRQRPQLRDADSDDWKNFILRFPEDWNHLGNTLPFMIGDISTEDPFVHVFDERAIEILLQELDTMQDFVEYLDQRAAIIRDETFTLAPSEEDLLAFYLRSFNCRNPRGCRFVTAPEAKHGYCEALARHRRAALVALAAAFDAFVHVTNLLTAVGAGLANRCASFAVVRMVIAVATHEVDAGCTSSDAIEHQLDVRLLDVVAAFGQAMTGQHVSTGRLALLAVFDALFHGCGCGTHSFLL